MLWLFDCFLCSFVYVYWLLSFVCCLIVTLRVICFSLMEVGICFACCCFLWSLFLWLLRVLVLGGLVVCLLRAFIFPFALFGFELIVLDL